MTKQKRDIKAEVTETLANLIREHGSDWIKPFGSLCGAPTNAVTGEKYKGMNALLLGCLGISWAAGYGQWQTIGAQVRKGSKAIAITAPMPIKDKETGDVSYMLFKPASVFDASQVEGWEAPQIDARDTTEVLADVDRYVDNLGADIRTADNGQAFYVPALDYVSMPPRSAFTDTPTSNATECYYSTLLHELVHWTGHKTRCTRINEKNNEKRGYAFEELVAEIGAAMLCAQLGVSLEVRPDHAKYLNNWLGALDGDKNYIYDAAKLAGQAVEYLDGLQSKPQKMAA